MSNLIADDDRPESPELFISYASGDRDRAATLHERLVTAGYKVWFDKARLTPGCDWHMEIEAGCEAARIIIPLITPLWARSEWTRYETYAHNVVIPVLAEGKAEDVLPPPLRRWNVVVLDPLAGNDLTWHALFRAIKAKLAEAAPVRTPRVVDFPYPANPFFVGRDDDLVRIHEELHAAPAAALIQGRVRALAAMGGIGKTTIANEYARRYWRLYPQILWVDARADLESGFAMLFKKLFPDRSDAGLQQSEKAKLVMDELSGRAERLLVLDNVIDADSVRPWLVVNPTSGCRTLITTRYADWSTAAGIRTIPLNVLEPEHARHFLLARTGRVAESTELEACDELARELGYLPLALEQAAAYIASPGAGVNFAGYLDLYHRASVALLARGALGSTEYPDSVITTWQATVAKLSPESRAVLRICAWYADTPIPRALVMEEAQEVFANAATFGEGKSLEEPTAVELRIRDALTGLARYSMILDATDKTFRVHGLVQAVERARAEAGDIITGKGGRTAELARQSALAGLQRAFPRYAFREVAVWPQCRELIPHVLSIRNHLGGHKSEDLGLLLDLAGQFLYGTGDVVKALDLIQQSVEIYEYVNGPDGSDTIIALNNLAACHLYLGNQEMGDFKTAEGLLRSALEACDRVLASDHPTTIGSVNNLAVCLSKAGDPKGAEPLHRRAFDVSKKALGGDHVYTIGCMNAIGGCLKDQGKFQEAKPLLRSALILAEQGLGPNHPLTVTIRNNLENLA